MVVNGKLVFTGKKQVVDVCSQKFPIDQEAGLWMFPILESWIRY